LNNRFSAPKDAGLPAKILFSAVLLLVLSCAKKTETPGDPENRRVDLPSLGISLDLPPSFKPLGGEELSAVTEHSLTVLELEPFTALPLYGFTDMDGKGTLIVSALELRAPAAEGGDPLSAVYAYQRSLEDFLKAGPISFEETAGEEISLLLMAMSFGEGEAETALFKGLYRKSPGRYFMLDLYIRRAAAGGEDALSYRTIFLSPLH
jgi:hypothetical protein